ncbi:MAG TPA: YiiX/YebB-like N1pC/P60 family cysteine hydrolase [Oscillatoriaceae cyanobacterium]
MRRSFQQIGSTAALAGLLALSGCGRSLFQPDARLSGGYTALDAALTPEESALLAEGLLPSSYPQLKATLAADGLDAAKALYRQGKPGPFDVAFGDPNSMLAAARFAHTHADYARLLRGLKRGDVVFVTENDPSGFISRATGGPFDHVLLCVDPAPPGQFLEAAGMTDQPGDPTGSRVRWNSVAGYARSGPSERLLRPAGLLPEGNQAAAIEHAIAFSRSQLGKPYNYTFSDKLAGDRAYYCSSLIYDAYTQAGVPWPMHKTPADDRLVLAFEKLLVALQPDDPLGLSSQAMAFMQQSPAPDSKALARFAVFDLLPHCRATAGIALSEKAKNELAAAIASLLDGNAFPHFTAAAESVVNDGGTGLEATSRLDAGLQLDGRTLAGNQDINAWQALKAFRIVLGAVLPYGDAVTALMTGPHSNATHAVSHLLDLLDRLHAIGVHWPFLGLQDLPTRAPWVNDPDFESPNDLAWGDEPHWDFNVPAGTSEDPPWPFAIVPPNGRFTLLAAQP